MGSFFVWVYLSYLSHYLCILPPRSAIISLKNEWPLFVVLKWSDLHGTQSNHPPGPRLYEPLPLCGHSIGTISATINSGSKNTHSQFQPTWTELTKHSPSRDTWYHHKSFLFLFVCLSPSQPENKPQTRNYSFFDSTTNRLHPLYLPLLIIAVAFNFSDKLISSFPKTHPPPPLPPSHQQPPTSNSSKRRRE